MSGEREHKAPGTGEPGGVSGEAREGDAGRAGAESWARTNDALRRTLELLASEPQLDKFLGHVLRSVAEQLGERFGAVWLYDPADDSLRLRISLEDGVIREAGGPDDPGYEFKAGAAEATRPAHFDGARVFVRTREELEGEPGFEPFRAYFDRFEFRSSLSAPLNLGDSFTGTLCIHSTRRETYTAEELELAAALARFATLAVELARLSDQARETAQARGQEKAAREREAELAEANNVLRQNLARLTDAPDVDSFIRHLLVISAERLQANSVSFWVFDRDAGVATRHLLYEGGLLSSPADDDERRATANFDELRARPFWREVVDEGRTAVLTPADMRSHDPELLARLEALGVKSMLAVPLVSGDQTLGVINFRFAEDAGVAQEKIELAQALACQATLALQLARLAEEAEQAAVAREQERAAREYAAELARANETLRRTLDVLAREQSTEAYLGQIVKAICEVLGVDSALLWQYDLKGMTASILLAFRGGRVRPGTEIDHPNAAAPMPLKADDSAVRALLHGRRPLITKVETLDSLSEELRSHLLAEGARYLLAIPLVLEDEAMGVFTTRLAEEREFPPAQLELAQALAHQATLAIQLTRLAEQAREAAVARERGLAAQELAAELTKANQALRGALDRLAGEPELAAFLRHVLLELRSQLGAVGAALFQLDAETGTLGLRMRVQEGRVEEAPDIEGLDPFLAKTPADVTPYWRTLVGGRRPLLLDAEDPAQASLFWPGTREWHLQSREPLALGVPLLMGDEALGFVGMTFAAGTRLSTLQLAMAQALAHQATLAIQMTRLAERAQKSAVLEERNRMARDIHDTLAQAFTGVVIQLEAARRVLGDESPEAEAHLTRAVGLAREGLAEARRSVQALRPRVLEQSELHEALSGLAARMSEGAGVEAVFRLTGAPRPLAPEVSENLLRIGQEALTNSLRHAGARSVVIELAYGGEGVSLKISDDGVGFDVEAASAGDGFGLLGMRERARRIGAALTVLSEPGRGAEVLATAPYLPGRA